VSLMASKTARLHRSVKSCHWDLKVVYTVDSSNAVWNDIDLCTVEKITIHYDKDIRIGFERSSGPIRVSPRVSWSQPTLPARAGHKAVAKNELAFER
jgi:hypothetical protein